MASRSPLGRPPKALPLDASRSTSPASRSNKPAKPHRSQKSPPAGYGGVPQFEEYAAYPDSQPVQMQLNPNPGIPNLQPQPPPRIRSARLDGNVTSLRDRVMSLDPSSPVSASNESGNVDSSGHIPRVFTQPARAKGSDEYQAPTPAQQLPAGGFRNSAKLSPSPLRETGGRPMGTAKGTTATTPPHSEHEEKKKTELKHKFLGKRGVQYGLWAHRMGYLCAVLCLVGGAFAVAFSRSKTYGCKIGDKFIHSSFRYNLQGNCPTRYAKEGSLDYIDVCCKEEIVDSNLAKNANGSPVAAQWIGALYMIYSVFIVCVEDITYGFGLWFPSDTVFYDKRVSPLGILHVIIGLIGLTNLGTCLAGVALVINGAVYLEALRREEAGDGGRAQMAKDKERAAKAKAAADEKRGKGGANDDEVEFECSTCPTTFANHPIFAHAKTASRYFCEIIQYNPLSFLYRIWQEDKLAAYFWAGAFVFANVVMFGVTYQKWVNLIEDDNNKLIDGTIAVLCDTKECNVNRIAIMSGPFSFAAPLAKACGGCLNMDCAILLLPVIKTLLRKMNDAAGKFQDLQDKTDYFGKFFAHSFARYVPIQKNIEFHKLIAFTVLLMTGGHVIGHYSNLVYSYDVTTAYFEKWGWKGTSFFTGAVIFVAMFIIFSAAADVIRHTKFEIFFNAHHMFIVFYIVMFMHGPVFWYWGSVPVALYIYERYTQTKKGGIPFVVTKVEFINPVMALYFKPVFSKDFKFKEGQYLYLSCPFISAAEWHPFTISSAQDDMTSGPRIYMETGEEVLEVPRPSNLHPNAKWNKYHLVSQNWKDLNPNEYIDKSETGWNDYVSCHIKIHGLDDPVAKTWTRKFKEYLEMVSGNVVGTNNFPFFFNSVDHRGDVQLGRLNDDEGRQILRVDGPHSAPSEHFTNYGTCMIIGGGIGLTPCASVISALIKHRWKRGLNPEIMHLYWVVRQGDVDSFQWLIHLLTELSYEYKKQREANEIQSSFYCEFNIFVTAAENDPKTPMPFQKPKRRWTGNATEPLFSADKLYSLMLNPTVPSKKMVDTMKRGGASPNRLQDIWIWNGRPDWDQIFADIKDQRQHSDIGVCFCGAPVIGNDLKRMCEKYSSSRDDCLFTLHKENF